MRDLSRQTDIVPIADCEGATVIGCGAIGRNVAIQLASVGIGRLQLIDFDTIEETNITTQGFLCSEVGMQKVTALSESIHRIDPLIDVETIDDRWKPKLQVFPIVFCCVDSIETRGRIWKSLQNRIHFFTDGRMLSEVIRVLTVSDGKGWDHYGSTLFPQSQAQTGRCTAQSTIYAATIAAGLMLHQFTRHLRGIATDQDVLLSLLASEMSA